MKTLFLVLCLASVAQAQDCSSGHCRIAPKAKAVIAAPVVILKQAVQNRPRVFWRGCFAR